MLGWNQFYQIARVLVLRFWDWDYVISGILVTGGGTNEAELYNPISKISCSLPQLPEIRSLHSQNGPLLCGGHMNTHQNTIQNCMLWNSGILVPSKKNNQEYSRWWNMDPEPHSPYCETLPQLLDPCKWNWHLSSGRCIRCIWIYFRSCQARWNSWENI